MNIRMLALAAGGMALATTASAANLVQNGDFNSPGAATAVLVSTGSTFITGWTNQATYSAYIPQGQTPDQTWQCCLLGSAGPGYGVANGMVGPPSGNASVVIDGTNGFGPGGGYGYIEQDIVGLISGQSYTLTFWQAGSQEYTVTGDQTEYFQVSLGDQSWNSTTMTVPSQGFAPWEKFSTTFTWDGVGNALQFAAVGSGEPAFALLADVSLTGMSGGVPEPSTWALMGLGFAGLSFAAVRRRRSAVARLAA
jgi:hypothetical protein